MAPSSKSNRREFLQGRAVGRALLDLTDAVAGPAATASPTAGRDGYLLQIARRAMACEFEVLLSAGRFPQGTQAAIEALDLVESLEAQLTVYRDSSEVSLMNARAFERDVRVEPGLFGLLCRAVELWQETGGAFDVTAGPLVKAWGFFQRQGAVPSADDLRAALARVGSSHLTLEPTARTVRYAQPGMEINLGAIGKGFALDRAADHLAAQGVDQFLLHGGQSSVLARGSQSLDEPNAGWPIGVRDPLRPQRRIALIALRNAALGTSGSGVQFFRHEGRRLGHVLDPRTGWPAEGVLSATVMAPSAADADALATALYCQGPDFAAEYCQRRPGVASLLVIPARHRDGIEVRLAGFADGQVKLL